MCGRKYVKHDIDDNSQKDDTNVTSDKCYDETFLAGNGLPKENCKVLDELSPCLTGTDLGMEIIGSILGKELNDEYFTLKLPSSAEFNIHVDTWNALFARKIGKCRPQNEWSDSLRMKPNCTKEN